MSVSSSSASSPHPHALARFPAEVQAAHARFQATGDVQAADEVLLAVLHEYMPDAAKRSRATPPSDESRLMEDLGFDSLAIAEVVFFLEDLYQVRIPQEQLLRLRSVGDLRNYLRTRLQPVRG